jgi:hypothetical protein
MIRKKHEQKFQLFLPKHGVCVFFIQIKRIFFIIKGNSFIDRSPDPLARLGDYNLSDFEIYFNSLRQSEKYGRPRLTQQSSNDLNNSQKTNPIINIPQLFLSSSFTLSDTSTFNLVFPGIIPSNRSLSPTNIEQQKSRTTSTSSEKSESNFRRQSTSSNNQTKSTSNGTLRYLTKIQGRRERGGEVTPSAFETYARAFSDFTIYEKIFSDFFDFRRILPPPLLLPLSAATAKIPFYLFCLSLFLVILHPIVHHQNIQ